MVEYNFCDKCKCKEESEKLIWIDCEDFEPKETDRFNSIKHQEAVEIFGFSALCEDCYLRECCN
jgi:hypothetical protein